MSASPALGRSSDFSESSRGKLVSRLLIASLIVSNTSFGLSMVRLGMVSLFVIPAAFGVTLIHNITVMCLLAKYKKLTTTPRCPTPPFLKHAGNIWPLALCMICWFGGGITALCVIANYALEGWMAADIIDAISGTLALVEGTITLVLLVLCWRALSREGYNGVECAGGKLHVTGGSIGIPMENFTQDNSNTTSPYQGGDAHSDDSLKKVPV